MKNNKTIFLTSEIEYFFCFHDLNPVVLAFISAAKTFNFIWLTIYFIKGTLYNAMYSKLPRKSIFPWVN